jgi:flavin reductase (DIM6/NTAB) family NADH-FMN oxidoreductase RutF/pimeloyl-ACP methyl ester carboxylesterase
MQLVRFARPDAPTLVADIGGGINDPAVLLLHGAGESRHVWAAVARALVAAGRYVVSLDLRGHGDSTFALDGDYSLEAYVEDVLFVVDSLALPIDLIGQRAGGLIAAAAAASSRVRGLVLIDVGFGGAADERQRVRSVLNTAVEGYANLEEASVRVASHRPTISHQSILGRLLRRGEDGRWRWRHDPLAISGPADRRIDLSRDGPLIQSALRLRNGPTLLIRTGASSLLSEAEGTRLSVDVSNLEFADLSTPIDGQGPRVAEAIMPALEKFLNSCAPRPPERKTAWGVDPTMLRKAFGCFATGVTILTTIAKDGRPVGLTANSFCSVSLDPPLLLFCIDRRAGSLPAFEECDSFAVNILPTEQQDLSNAFVKKGVDRFADRGWETWEASVPIVQDAMAMFECDKHQVLDGGDHRIFIGMVRHVWFDPSKNPLLFFQGKYRSVHVAQ